MERKRKAMETGRRQSRFEVTPAPDILKLQEQANNTENSFRASNALQVSCLVNILKYSNSIKIIQGDVPRN